ncbi:MAG: hypothetical protein SOX40_02400, partial [Bacteroidaceae bacterium]|nr:hypothetical protein [Bacteroidaceae bacterium]
ILLLSSDDSFAEHREYLDHSVNFIVRGCHIFVERRQNLRNIIFPASLKGMEKSSQGAMRVLTDGYPGTK